MGGAVVRALSSHRFGPGFKSQCQRHMWVEFVVGSLPCSVRFFSGYSSKTNISKFQFDQQSGRRSTTKWMCYLQIVIYFIHSFVRSFIRSLLVYLFTLLPFLFLSLPGTEEGKIHKCSKTYSSQFLETYDVSVIAYCFVVMSRLFNCNLWCLFTLVFLPNLVCCSKSSTRPIGLVSSRGCLALTVVLPT